MVFFIFCNCSLKTCRYEEVLLFQTQLFTSGSRTRVGSSGTISAGVVSGTGAGAADAFSGSYTGSSSGVSKVSSNSSSYKSTALLSCSLQRAICALQEGSAAHRPAEQRSVSFLRSSPVLRRARRGIQMGFDKIPLNNIAQFAEKRKWKLLTFPRSFHFFTVSSYSRRASISKRSWSGAWHQGKYRSE